MKRSLVKKLAVTGVALSMALSTVTVYAGEIEIVDEAVTETTSQTSTLEQYVYQLDTTGIQETSLDEMENWKNQLEITEEEAGTAPVLAIVYQPESYWAENESGEEVVVETVQDTLPEISLTEEEVEQVKEFAELGLDLVVVTNGSKLSDITTFADEWQVKAVVETDEKTEEGLKNYLAALDLQEAYASYDEELNSALLGTNKTRAAVSNLPGTTLEGSGTTSSSSTSGTEKSTESETSSTSGTTATTKKDITFTMVPDPLEEGDDTIYAVYEITCPSDVKISEATFTLTYDSTKMSYDSDYSDAGTDILYDEDTNKGFNYTAVDNNGTLKITLKTNSGSSETMSGAVLDLGFTLKEETSVGDSYDLKLAVTSLKDGTTDLTGDSNVNITVKEESIKTIAYEDETETETQTETQAQTQVQTETQAQTQSTDLQTAAKTGDNTNLIVWVILMVAAAGCIVVFVVKKQKQK
jgi:hypothetical protein